MPIRPENRSKYPADWPELVRQVATRAGGRCECLGECGIAHAETRCAACNGFPNPETGSKTVLTTAHLDHDPSGRDPNRLRQFCQRCHNRYDAPVRRAGTLDRQRQASALGDLFDHEGEDHEP